MSTQRRKFTALATLVSVVMGVAVITLVQSSPASAHHSEVTASVDCSGTVAFSARAWDPIAAGWPDDPTSRTNPNVLVWLEVGGSVVDSRTGEFSPANGFSFSGTFQWPAGATSATVWIQEQAPWGNGTPPNSPRKVRLKAPADCGSKPAVSSKWECVNGDGVIVVTFTNSASVFGSPVDFIVSSPITETVTVAPGGTEQRTYGPLPDGPATVAITVNGNNQSQTQTIDCDQPDPRASYTSECVNGQGVVTINLANVGSEGTTFTVTFLGQTTNVDIPAGGSKTLSFDNLADGDYPLNVTAGGKTLISESVVVDCRQPEPKATYTVECVGDNGKVVFTLVNTGTEGTTFKVEFNGTTQEVRVEPGETKTIVVEGLADGTYPAAVTAYGKTLIYDNITIKCDRPGTPEVSSTTECADNDGVARIVLKNVGGELPLTFVVDGTPVVVAANGSETVTLTGLNDGTRTVKITVEGLPGSFDQVITTKCDKEPTVTFAPECVDGDGVVKVTLNNNGDDRDVVFTVQGQDTKVAPSTSTVISVGPFPDGPATITYQIDGQPNPAATYSFSVACDRPGQGGVSLEVKCVAGTADVLITLRNDAGDLPVKFVVNGTEYSVAPGATKVVTVSDVPDGKYTPTITADGKPVDISIDVDCDLPVLAATAICNEVQKDGTTYIFWYTVRNTEATPVEISWNGGTATLAPGESKQISATSNPLVIKYGTDVVLNVPSSTDTCSIDVRFTKEVLGPGEDKTYKITVSQLVEGTYFKELTFDIKPGVPTTVTLPSALGESVPYKVEETDTGGAQIVTITPDRFELDGHRAETVNVTITNAFAAIDIRKSVSATQSEAGQELTYRLAATNTGGLPLENVVISDRLPKELTYTSATVIGGGGTCSLADSAKPQLVVCVLSEVLSPGSTPALIDIVAKIDEGTPVDTNLQNQAKAQGAYFDPAKPAPNDQSVLAAMKDAAGNMSCVPTVRGAVCDMSAAVSTVVIATVVLPPTTTSTTTSTTTPPTSGVLSGGGGATTTLAAVLPPGQGTTPRPPAVGGVGGQLPTTGTNGTRPVLAIAMASVALGALLVLMRRKPAGQS
jgi:uncharacterized repeat protein (TIGR01451 family)/LPXTG-motif cell wall-anchored protein